MPSNSEQPADDFDGTLTIDQAMELACGAHRAGLLQAADELYRRILVSVPEHVDALHLLGLACYQMGQREEGTDLVRRAVALAPEHADALNNLGNMLLEQGRLDEATDAYERVLTARPNHADAHSNVGAVLRRRGKLSEAEAHFRRAIEIKPDHGIAHHNLGSVVRDQGRSREALEWFQRALILRPYDGESYRRVGATLSAVGRIAEASTIYERWVALEPKNPLARHMLAACSGRDVPARASDEFVQETFDAFAESFDAVLEKLDYRAPALVVDAVRVAIGASHGALDILDAGVGSGLCGSLLRPFARHLVGVDLSPKMLAKADERHVYDILCAAELTRYMLESPAAFDVVVSADTLVYFGDLTEVLAAAAATLRPGGRLVFTLEEDANAGSLGYRLKPHGRYGHTERYVRDAVVAAGFPELVMERVFPRLENQVRVEGFLLTAQRKGGS